MHKKEKQKMRNLQALLFYYLCFVILVLKDSAALAVKKPGSHSLQSPPKHLKSSKDLKKLFHTVL